MECQQEKLRFTYSNVLPVVELLRDRLDSSSFESGRETLVAVSEDAGTLGKFHESTFCISLAYWGSMPRAAGSVQLQLTRRFGHRAR